MGNRDRLREPDARRLVLRLAAARPNRDTTTIKKQVPDYVRRSIFSMGYAERLPNGIRVTVPD